MPGRTELVKIISDAEPMAAILATGSAPSDLKDLLAIGACSREEYLSTMRDHLSRAEINSYPCDDALVVDSPSMGVAYYNHDTFVTTVKSLANGEIIDPVVKPWSVGPWLPETFADDLRRAIPVYRANDFYDLVRTFDDYPTPLREGVCARSALEIQIKSRKIEGTKKSLSKSILAADICFAGLRYIHADNRQYFRGMRYLNETITTLPRASQSLAAKLAQDSSAFILMRDIVS